MGEIGNMLFSQLSSLRCHLSPYLAVGVRGENNSFFAGSRRAARIWVQMVLSLSGSFISLSLSLSSSERLDAL